MSSVLEIANYMAPYKGNFIASLLSLADALKKRGVQTVFLFPPRTQKREWAAELSARYPVFFLPQDGKGTVKLLRRICRQYDVCHVHSHFIDKSVYIPLRIACGGIPHTFHAHSLPKFGENDRLLPLRRSLLHAGEILCVSEPVAAAYSRRGYGGCTVVPNGIDFARLDGCEALPLPHPLVLCFGYDIRIKGIDTILDAFARYDTDHIYTLGICAAGHMRRVEEAVRAQLGEVPPWIRILPGREDVGAYYAGADVLVSASRQEGMPYAVLEAAYCGLPLALSDIPPHRSLDLPGVRYFAPEAPEALFRAVKEAAQDTHAPQRRDTVLKRFSMEEWTRAVLSRLFPEAMTI